MMFNAVALLIAKMKYMADHMKTHKRVWLILVFLLNYDTNVAKLCDCVCSSLGDYICSQYFYSHSENCHMPPIGFT